MVDNEGRRSAGAGDLHQLGHKRSPTICIARRKMLIAAGTAVRGNQNLRTPDEIVG